MKCHITKYSQLIIIDPFGRQTENQSLNIAEV